MSAMLWIAGGLLLVFAWAGMGAGADEKKSGNDSTGLNLISLALLVVAVLCWRFA